jgi:MFS family permease
VTTAASRAVVPAVMAGHFVAAFAALGMPPFFALVLQQSLHNDAQYLAGWLYVLPTAFAAVSSPWWGRLADRYGKKRLLIRAQLGLAASFLLAGYASNTWTFAAALALQGVLGGTFAASNAYLATETSGPALARSLTAMQWSARAALVAAPLALGLVLQAGVASPITVYRWLALLPLAAALLAAFLPAGGAAQRAPLKRESASVAELSAKRVYALQFAFVFATVVTFPYFASHVQQQFNGVAMAAAGLLFGLPHAVYLLAAWPLTRWSARGRRSAWLAAAFAVLLLSVLGQALTSSLAVLCALRVLMGVAMTLGFIALHGLIAATVHAGNAGRSFGWFESSSKWGAVAAGLGAGFVAQAFGLHAPYILAAAVLLLAIAWLALMLARTQTASSSVLQGENACTRPTPSTQS